MSEYVSYYIMINDWSTINIFGTTENPNRRCLDNHVICLNGGTCVENGDDLCLCAEGYMGTFCEIGLYLSHIINW